MYYLKLQRKNLVSEQNDITAFAMIYALELLGS